MKQGVIASPSNYVTGPGDRTLRRVSVLVQSDRTPR